MANTFDIGRIDIGYQVCMAEVGVMGFIENCREYISTQVL